MWKEDILSAVFSIPTTDLALIHTLSYFQGKEQFEGQSAENIDLIIQLTQGPF
jgi:hypothetical protein